MAAEMPHQMELRLGPGISEVDYDEEDFNPFPIPRVRSFGAKANAAGRPLANLVDFHASQIRYLAVIELPQIKFCDREVEWSVTDDGEVTIEGQITPAAIYAGGPITGNKRNRVQLCPSKPWAISFYFPGPVDHWTAASMYTEDHIMEITAEKRHPEVETSNVGSKSLVPVVDVSASNLTTLVPVADLGQGLGPEPDAVLLPSEHIIEITTEKSNMEVGTSGDGSTALVPVVDVSAFDSTTFVPVPDLGRGLGPEPDAVLLPSDYINRDDGWFV